MIKKFRSQRVACVACYSVDIRSFGEKEQDSHQFHLARCTSCGLVFVTDPLMRKFPESSEVILPELPKARHEYLFSVIDNISRDQSCPLNVLEIGCGTGALGHLLQMNMGTEINYLGVEINPQRATVATNRGINVHQGPAQQLSAITDNKPSWHVIILDNVLEHLEQPGKVMEEAASLLGPDGYMLIIVPNRYDIRRILFSGFRRNSWIPLAHINYFNPASLDSLLMRSHLEICFPDIPVKAMTGKRTRMSWWIKGKIESRLHVSPFGLYRIARRQQNQ